MRSLRLGALLALVMTVTGGCSVQVGDKAGRMDERGPAIWSVDSRPYSISKTFFQARGSDLTFVVEWECSDCDRQAAMSDEEALVLSRPVLWHAFESGAVNRTMVKEIGRGPLHTTRLVSVLTYKLKGQPESISIAIDEREIDKLFDWTWILAGRSYHVTKPGYDFFEKTQSLFFSVRWEAPELCGELRGMADDRAAMLAMPLFKEVVRRSLFKTIPAGDARLGKQPVTHIGVAITCPCVAGSMPCENFGYRVARTPAEIAAAP